MPEDRVVVFDPDADVVVISTPDLIWTVTATDEPVWRETKTANSMPPDLEAALNRYPGFALNVALLAADAGVEQRNAHAELEVVTPVASEGFYISIEDGQKVSLAQQILADIARRYAADLEFSRRENAGCPRCHI